MQNSHNLAQSLVEMARDYRPGDSLEPLADAIQNLYSLGEPGARAFYIAMTEAGEESVSVLYSAYDLAGYSPRIDGRTYSCFAIPVVIEAPRDIAPLIGQCPAIANVVVEQALKDGLEFSQDSRVFVNPWLVPPTTLASVAPVEIYDILCDLDQGQKHNQAFWPGLPVGGKDRLAPTPPMTLSDGTHLLPLFLFGCVSHTDRKALDRTLFCHDFALAESGADLDEAFPLAQFFSEGLGSIINMLIKRVFPGACAHVGACAIAPESGSFDAAYHAALDTLLYVVDSDHPEHRSLSLSMTKQTPLSRIEWVFEADGKDILPLKGEVLVHENFFPKNLLESIELGAGVYGLTMARSVCRESQKDNVANLGAYRFAKRAGKDHGG